jgi:hypothetical protein
MPLQIFDTEIYPNYFLAAFRDVDTGRIRTFELYGENATFSQPEADRLRLLLKSNTSVSFNGNNFDMPLLAMALQRQPVSKIKAAADGIILRGLRPYQIENTYKFSRLNYDHIDLIEVSPGMVGLKTYGGRLHCRKMQDLPIDPTAILNREQKDAVKLYCQNDLTTTLDLYNKLKPQIELRERMGVEYGIDLRSKSDAQIAEAVIKSKVKELLGKDVSVPKHETGEKVTYRAPEYLQFTSTELQEVLRLAQEQPFIITDTGKLDEPPALKNRVVTIGKSKYRMGIGGLHSMESCAAHHADEHTLLVDRDVASYYPAIILSLGLAPHHMGDAFLKVYRTIVERRLEAKRTGDKVTNESLKITINGSFGKFGSKWSVLYSPDLLIRTTVTGQFALLMLIEMLEAEGIPVVSANTDGIVIKCPKVLEDTMNTVVFGWECVTGFETEANQYASLYSRDVNNYIALKQGGGHKTKGVYATSALSKNPSGTVCVEAAIEFLKHGTPVEDTVRGCDDLRKFLFVRSVKGGALDQWGDYLGKSVRWYYSRLLDTPLTYKINGYKVPRSEGAQALMELPDEMPDDIDHQWYIDEARRIVAEVGAA